MFGHFFRKGEGYLYPSAFRSDWRSQLPAGEDWRPEKSSGEVIILHCEECTVVPRGTEKTKIRYREYKGGSATHVYSGLGDY